MVVQKVKIRRLLTAMVTTFSENNEVDCEQAQRLAVALINSGSDGLVVTGTTGENPTLFHEENFMLWSAVKEVVGNRAAVIAGSGTNSTNETILLSREAEKVGVDGLLLVVPYYNKPSQEGLYRHFRAVAESTSLPCILYNVPSRTVVNMTAETTLRLANDVPNIIGTKEASSDFLQIDEIIKKAPKGFRVWSGNDSDILRIMKMGGYGVISVASHLVGRQIKHMIELIVNEDYRVASRENKRLMKLFKGLFVVTNPVAVKYCLNHVGFNVGGLRLPLVEADTEIVNFLDNLLGDYVIDLPVVDVKTCLP